MLKKLGKQHTHRKYTVEGLIEVGEVSESTIFFNSKFESGNLRQAFRVPKD